LDGCGIPFDARMSMILEVTNDTGGSRMSNFRAIDRDTGYLLPPSVDKWLPEQHLAWFVVGVICVAAAVAGSPAET